MTTKPCIEKAQTAKELSIKYYKEGYFCSEAILKTYEELSGVELPDMVKRGMTSLAEGIGGTGCLCGAVHAIIFVAGMYTGRVHKDESVSESMNISHIIMDRFKEKHKSACCRVLTKNASLAFGVGKYRHCPGITGDCAEILFELACEEGWF